MKWIKILNPILNLILYFALLSAFAVTLFFVMAVVENDFSFGLGNYHLQNVHWSFYPVVVLSIISEYILVLMIYKMRQASRLLRRGKIIDKMLSKKIYQAGVLSVIGIILNRVPAFFYDMIHHSDYNNIVKMNSTLNLLYSFDSMLIILCYGIFLIIAARMIQITVTLKEENDLTI